MQRGIKERFGEDILARLSSEKQLPMATQRDDGSDINWVLTKWSLQDRLGLDMKAVSRSWKDSIAVNDCRQRIIADNNL